MASISRQARAELRIDSLLRINEEGSFEDGAWMLGFFCLLNYYSFLLILGMLISYLVV